MPRKPKWTYYPWAPSGKPLPKEPVHLKFQELLETHPSQIKGKAKSGKLEGMIEYADISYLSCRILMLSSIAVHPAALYMAGQTIEKYLKAVLLKRKPELPLSELRTHKLTKLAGQVGGPFADREFVQLCEHIEKFDIAGRYFDHALEGWGYSLNLLAFLDAFVVRCREITGMPLDTPNRVTNLLDQKTGQNQVMAAALQAVSDNNRHLDELRNPPMESKAPPRRSG